MTELKIGITLPTIGEIETLGGIDAAACPVAELGFESVWAADLIVGDGTPSLESTIALALAAAVTERVHVGFSVLVLPLRPPAWAAAQIQTLQHVSGGRVILGIGSGGFPGASFWQAVGGPARGRGRMTDAALDVPPPYTGLRPLECCQCPWIPARPSSLSRIT
jgi:alkanesulfonate monooxygenase SsuD/methylene tetrahydromethanopterin reductase-like flavin-dependent oxidoreductase (luciferase family)